MARAVLATLIVCATLAPARLRADDADAAIRRAGHLRHGINASEWFAQSGDYSRGRLESYTTPDDIRLMRRLGFDHVRLSVDPEPLACLERHAECDFVAVLDRTVDLILGQGMAVIVDLHPSDAYKHALATGDAAVDRFLDTWRALAAHYAGRDPERLFFEVLNEPEMNDAYRWQGLEERAAAVIRRNAPRQTIVATGARYSDIDDLLRLLPLADRNVVYNFHFYEPHIFTHQGATWGMHEWRGLQSVPYPSTPENVAGIVQSLPEAPVRLHVEQYGLSYWNGRHIAGEIEVAASWARANRVPLICDEFGVYREHSEPAARDRWIEDARRAFEANSIGWTMWDYRGGFGVVRRTEGGTAVDPAVVRALGLRASP